MAAAGSLRASDHKLLELLLGGATVTAAATEAGMAARTIYRRLQEPAFQQALQQGRQRAVGRAVMLLSDGAAEAAHTLRQLARQSASDGIRLAAARAVLDFSLRGLELLDLAERVSALEQQQAAAPEDMRRSFIVPRNGSVYDPAPPR